MYDAVYFDMDGTIVDLYGVEGWEALLRAEDPTPYVIAKPLVNMNSFNRLIENFQRLGVTVGAITWLSKDSSPAYSKAVRAAKIEWLEFHCPALLEEPHFIRYGATKRAAAVKKNSILVDDNEKVRNGWRGYAAIDATGNFMKELKNYLKIKVDYR